MRTVYGGSLAGATRIDGQILQPARKIAEAESNQRGRPDKSVRRANGDPIYFWQIAAMAYPVKTEANIAFIARVDVRTVRRWLADNHEPPADVFGLVMAEILRCYGRR